MYKISQTSLGLIGGIVGPIIMGLVFLTLSSVIAAPTQSPPNGNPTFELQGEKGNFTSCRHRSVTCPSPAFGGCSVTATVTSGWKMTGGECGVIPGAVSLMDSTVAATDGSISCYCHDFVFAQSGTCIANIWECQ